MGRLLKKSSRRLIQEALIGLSKEGNEEIFFRSRSRIDQLLTTLSREF